MRRENSFKVKVRETVLDESVGGQVHNEEVCENEEESQSEIEDDSDDDYDMEEDDGSEEEPCEFDDRYIETVRAHITTLVEYILFFP